MASSNYLKAKLYDHTLRGIPWTAPASTWLQLYTNPPTDAGGGTPIGPRAQMLAANWAASSNGVGVYNGTVSVPLNQPSPVTIRAAALWDASSGGNMLVWGLLPSPVLVPASTAFVVGPGDLAVTFR
jgi:hypothetical protein